jgi:hypothetical protein
MEFKSRAPLCSFIEICKAVIINVANIGAITWESAQAERSEDRVLRFVGYSSLINFGPTFIGLANIQI